jgi:hypothetical protein
MHGKGLTRLGRCLVRVNRQPEAETENGAGHHAKASATKNPQHGTLI